MSTKTKSKPKSSPKAAKKAAPEAAAVPAGRASVNVATCVKPEERDALEKAAKGAGLSLSAYIRHTAFKDAGLEGAERRPGRPRR